MSLVMVSHSFCTVNLKKTPGNQTDLFYGLWKGLLCESKASEITGPVESVQWTKAAVKAVVLKF